LAAKTARTVGGAAHARAPSARSAGRSQFLLAQGSNLWLLEAAVARLHEALARV